MVLARLFGLKLFTGDSANSSSEQADLLSGTGVLFQRMPDESFAITQAIMGSPAAAVIGSGSVSITDRLMAVDGVLLHGKAYEEL